MALQLKSRRRISITSTLFATLYNAPAVMNASDPLGSISLISADCIYPSVPRAGRRSSVKCLRY
jgi:hypothetical protein